MELSLYRKYRPQTFADVVGQDHVSRTLQNAVRSGKVAHAYVFAGPRGIGKTSMAKILAKALNCEGPDAQGNPVTSPTITPCGTCESCRAIAASTALDVIEMDAASNRGIDDIRDLRDKVGFAPVRGRSKVYIVDEAHMLTKEAFNALLKTLEEPPPHVVFVLATTEVHKLPETIISRCQRFDFRRPHVHDIARVLGGIAEAESIDIDEQAVLEIARHAEGGFRDAIGTLEKLNTFIAGQRITSREVLEILGVIESELLFELTDIVIEGDAAGALLFVQQRLAEHGTSVPQFIRDLLRHLRHLFILRHIEEASDDAVLLRSLSQNLEIDDELLDRLLQQASQIPPRQLLRFIELLGDAQNEIRAGLDARLQLELVLVKMTRPEIDHTPAALEERLRRLEAGSVPLPARKAPLPPLAPPAKTATPAASPPAAEKPAPTTAAKPAPPAAAEKPAPPAAEAPAVAANESPATPADDSTATVPDEAPAASTQTAPEEAPAAVVAEEPEPASAGTPAVPPEETASTPAYKVAAEPSPVASESATGAASPPHEPTDAERVVLSWPVVLEQVQAQSFPLYAHLRDAHASAEPEGTLEIAVGSDLALRKLGGRDNLVLLRAIIRTATGCEPEIRVVRGDGPVAGAHDDTEPAHDVSLDMAQAILFMKDELGAVELPDDDERT